MSDRPLGEQSSSGQSAVARGYDRWAAGYDSDLNPTRDLDAELLRRAPLHVSGQRVLELGCGTGKNTVWLAEQARELLALDFSPGMLAVARARVSAPHVRFAEHDIRAPWPVDDGTRDLVVGNLVLEHVAELAPVFAEAARVLRSGGQLYLCELHPYRQLRGSQARFTDPSTGETVPVPAHVHTTSEYVNGGIRAGFRLAQLGESLEHGAPADAPPRVLTMLFERE